MSKYTELQERVSNVTKELHRIEKEVKELAKKEKEPKYKIGEWLWVCHRRYSGDEFHKAHLIRVINIKDGLLYADNGLPYKEDYCIPATRSEIEAHLIKEAERRGYKNGVLIKWPVWSRPKWIRVPLEYSPDHNCLYDDNGSVVWEYGYGWATIMQDKKPLPKTKEEYTSFLIAYFENMKDVNTVPFLDQYDFSN